MTKRLKIANNCKMYLVYLKTTMLMQHLVYKRVLHNVTRTFKITFKFGHKNDLCIL